MFVSPVPGIVAHAGLDLPLSTATATVVLGIGFVVVAVVALDAYRRHVA